MNFRKFQDIFTKVTVVQIIFVAVAVGGVLFFEKFFNRKPPPVISESDKKAVLLIDLDNMTRKFEGEVVEKMTVLDALNASIAIGNIKLTYAVDGNNDTVVTKINDHIATEDKVFYFYVNKKKVKAEDINKVFVYPGNQITIKLE